ncbi:glycosyltransferase family 2 protein [Priestia endophytica]|uniref:Glycosyltransferase n=1 Tax=Priestia endophytica TaxID=135735 RepID=A0AAX1QGI5_9BACI|nr:glycosyltransferase family A protein [Priestia endophytica]RAS82294.1 glycosyltransferase [Priestia endophytica]
MCKVSVVLPVYNAAKTIDKCIESIVKQTFTDWELICCDDCSTDETVSILERWRKKDSRIKLLLNEQNKRAAYTRNKCIREAKGSYIALIDDDDYCALDRLEKQVEFLDNHKNYSLVGSQGHLFDEKGVWARISPVEAPKVKDFLWNSCFLNPSVMIRKSDMEAVGLYRVSKETRRGQDYDLFLRMYAKGFKGFNIQEPLLFYYRGRNSYPKCKYEYRIDEAKIRYRNFKQMDLLPKYYPYVIKPLIVGLIPISLLEKIKHRRGRGDV